MEIAANRWRRAEVVELAGEIGNAGGFSLRLRHDSVVAGHDPNLITSERSDPSGRRRAGDQRRVHYPDP
jgi:hypothetical protein